MSTGNQVKIAAPAAQTPVAKTASQQPPSVGALEAPVLAEQMERARLGYNFGAISVFPPDPPIQPKRAMELGPRLSAFNSPRQSRANPASVIPKGWALHPPIQAKLTVGQPNDPYEQEADRVADQVMRMAEPRVQAKCACGGEAGGDGECAACKAQRLSVQRQAQNEPAEAENSVQAKPETAPAEAVPDLESRLNGSRGSGQALPEATRSSMESAFGVDFGGVRVHTDGEAVQMNKELSAHAFTHGSDIYFNAGKYAPGSSEGKELLAHELTHVVQQNQFLQQKIIQRKPKDQKADNSAIKYEEVTAINKINWREFGFNYINIFKHKGYTPFDTPFAYANEVYKLQKIIVEAVTTADLAKFPVSPNGVLDKPTVDWLTDFAVEAAKDSQSKQDFVQAGIDEEILSAFLKIAKNNITPEPLLSRDFLRHELFAIINSNKTFLLTVGDQNGAVRILQEVLVRLNYNVGEKGPDGKFGEDTRKALRAFQLESGLSKQAADGKLGYKTLRLLDQRISTASKDNLVSTPGGNLVTFKVPVSTIMDKQAKLLHAIVYIFQITEKQALDLINNKDKENKWGWLKEGFRETTAADLNRGYEYISVPVKDYETIVTILKQKIGTSGEPVEPKLKELSLDITEFGKVYGLTKEIEKLKSDKAKAEAISQLGTMVGGSISSSPLISLYEKQIASKEKERREELQRLGITDDIYGAKTEEFKKLFAAYAVKVAFEMLDRNERQASLEMIRYKKSGDPNALEEGAAVKDIFVHLDEVWSRAEAEWWQGISVDQGAAPNDIKSYSSLNTYLKEKKGKRTITDTKHGEVTEPADLVLPGYEFNKFKKREGNAYFLKAFDSNLEAHKFLTKSAEDYPVLAYPKLELRANISKYKAMSADEIEEKLFATGENIKTNIAKTREALANQPMNVYKLKPVIELAKFQLGIFPDTIQDNLVKDALEKFEDQEFWRNIALAALGLGLGLLALVSGPVGWAALAGGIVVGSVDAYLQYQDITFQRGAANTAFDPAKALSDVEPGYFWFYVSIAFIGLDVFQGLKAVTAAAKAAKATEEGAQLATKILTALDEDKKAIQKLIEQGGDNLAELTEQLKKLNKAISSVDAEKLAKQLNVLRHLEDVPQAVLRLSSALEQPEALKAFETMAVLLKKSGLSDESFKTILKFYAGPGNDFVAELPELMRLAQKTEWAGKPELLKEMLTNPRSQKIMLDFGENQDQFLKLWDEWGKLRSAGKPTNFADFLKEKGFITDLRKTTSLAEELGTGFKNLPTLTKNQQVLRTIEPALADALIDGKLPKRIEEALNHILQTDIIGQSTNLARAQQRMKLSLHLLGASIESPAEYQQVVRLLKTAEARMAVFEKATSLAGHEEYIGMLAKYGKELKADPKALDDLLKIGPFTDADTFEWLLHNGEIRKLIADNPALVKALKKCASPCFPIYAKPEDIKRVLTVIQANGDKVDYAKLNQYMYLNRPRTGSAADLAEWEKAITALEKDFKGTMKSVTMPKGKEIPLPPRYQPGGATPLKNAAEKLDVLIKRGFSPKQLEDILVQANINRVNANEFMEQLSRATAKLTTRPLDNISGIVNGLSSTNPQKFETAYHFIRRIGDYSSGAGVDVTEKVFAVFDINEIAKLRYSASARLSADVAKATGETSVAGLELFGSLVNRIDGSSDEIIKLASKAGVGGEEDIVRLAAVVESMPKGKHSLAAVEAKIADLQKLTQKIAMAGDKMGDEIWEVSKTASGKWEVGGRFIDEASGKISGSKAIAYIKGRGEEIAQALLSDKGVIEPAQWKIFRNSIEKTDLSQAIKNNIIGEMWGKVNVTVDKKILGRDNVIEFITIRIKGTDTQAVVDAALKKGGKVSFKEFKSGDAILSQAQEKVYEKMALGLTDELEPVGENAAKVWPDKSTFSVSKVEIVVEPVIP